ncbi:MAG: prepilin-type N-terminal cleavage/methylation domain-containing protein [Candidatus Omnitrophota bacterium]
MTTGIFQKKTSGKGLSLIEVSISIAILGIMLVSMLSMFTQGYRYVRKSAMLTRALLLAQQRMEELSDYTTAVSEAKHALTNMPFFRTVSVTILFGGDLKQISVTMSWAGEKLDAERSVTLVKLLANY